MNALAKLTAAAAAVVAMFSAAADAQDWRLNPLYGTVTLNSGFLPDPHTRTITAGGPIRISPMAGCPGGGYVANAPDYRLNYRAGRLPLSLYVRASGDTILLVNAPNAQWYCNDDYSGLNPGMMFNSPMSGQWDIWVGTYGPSLIAGSTLYISEFQPFQY
jgi:hypothetical protein